MYAKDTILVLKEQRPPDEETGEDFAYNKVRVIGQSPVTSGEDKGYSGPDADGVLLEGLTNFGGNLDEPFGRVKELYDVESIPEVEVPAQTTVKVVDAQSAQAGPTPEEVFAEEAPGIAPEPGQRRGRTSPFEEVRGPKGSSPLDTPAGPTRQEIATPPAPPLMPDTPVREPEPAPAAPPTPPVEPPEAPPSAPENE